MTTTALSEALAKLRQIKVPNWPAGRILGDIADEIESALASAEPVASDDIDSIALSVARRFTADDDPRHRARMQLRIIEAIKGEPACGQPIAWIRFCSDGTYEGPTHDSQMDSIRRRSGAWRPLVEMSMGMSVAGDNHDQ